MIVLKFVALALLIGTNNASKGFNTTGRIYNGNNAAPKQIPYIAMLKIVLAPHYEEILCGGSLIGTNWVLTAAHCVDRAARLEVVLGATTFNDPEKVYKVGNINIRIHPDWDDSNDLLVNDIAVIKIPFTEPCDKIQQVPLPKIGAPHAIYVHQHTITSGWGRTKTSSISPILQWVRVKVMHNFLCAQRTQGVTSDKVCVDTGYSHKSPCFGDSGGPLVLESTGELIGVMTSINARNCDLGMPVLFTRVASYLQWIHDTTGIPF